MTNEKDISGSLKEIEKTQQIIINNQKTLGRNQKKIHAEAACFGLAVGICAVVGFVDMGPIDFSRTVYNQMIGDTSTLKAELLDYSRDELIYSTTVSLYHNESMDDYLAHRLGCELKDGKVVQEQISIGDLWDLTEDISTNWFDRWIWPSK